VLPSGAPLSEWLAWLETLSPTEIDLGLERTQRVLERLELPRPPHVLLLAGTNGKGSSVAMADALLRASGYRTGAYTSPHIRCFNERIVVDGIPESDAGLIAAFERVEAARRETELTYFEFGTLAAAVVFAAADLDVWILEVGLGGRLDATNAIDPTASLITNVSLDHCDWLGHDVESIAFEKAGVMRSGVATVFGDRNVPASVVRQAPHIGATLLRAGQDYDFDIHEDGTWSWRGPSGTIADLQAPGLAGEFQTGNAAAVLMLLEAAGLSDAVDTNLINKVLPEVSLMGRLQRLTIDAPGSRGNEWLLDVAHNPAAAEVLAMTLLAMRIDGGTIAIVGLLDDKDVEGVVGPLLVHVDRWIAMTADSHRAIAASELARRIANLAGRACLVAESTAAAIELARRTASENDRILATGSFFTVSPILELLTTLSRTKS
jgi:dihydrofolate synthase/folylpolyglutamate synthase